MMTILTFGMAFPKDANTHSSVLPRQGSWSLQFERGSGLVILRSALWPGFSFYHVPGTAKFGHLYVGTGERNKDLPFML